MAPAPKASGAAKKGGADKKADKGPPVRKSVDGDGCWDVESNQALDCFEFVGAKGAPARAGEGGSESAVLRNKYGGQWRTILGEQCYMTGVHYLAVRVEGFSRNGLPTTDIGSAWFVGVGSRHCPLDGDLSELAYVELDSAEGAVVERLQDVPTAPKLWALGLANYTEQPLGPGKIIATPACIHRTPPRAPGAAKALSVAASPLALEPVALLPHTAKVHSGDVIGMRVDVDAGTVGFWVNKKHVKDVHLNVDCASWGALASTSDARIKFSLLTKLEQREAAIWDEHARQEIEEAVIEGSKVLGGSGRQSEGKALADALSSGNVHQAEQAVLWGIAPTPGWLELLTPEGILTVRRTVRAMMGSRYRVKPGGVSVRMVEDKPRAAARSPLGAKAASPPGAKSTKLARAPASSAASNSSRMQSPVSPKAQDAAAKAQAAGSPPASSGPPPDVAAEGGGEGEDHASGAEAGGKHEAEEVLQVSESAAT